MIFLGSDHGGLELKNKVVEYLKQKGVQLTDCGTYNGESVDYPDFASVVCQKVLEENAEFGILFCGTGIGVSMAANKVNGIRAALLCNTFSAQMAREHNDANIICFGSRTTTFEQCREMLDAFMSAKFEGGRHAVRVGKIMAAQEQN